MIAGHRASQEKSADAPVSSLEGHQDASLEGFPH